MTDQNQTAAGPVRRYAVIKQRDLPFVALYPRGSRHAGINSWAVNPPNDFGQALYYGKRLALLALSTVNEDRELGRFFSDVALSQIKNRLDVATCTNDYAMVAGFWQVIGQFAAVVATPENIAKMAGIYAEERERNDKFIAECEVREKRKRVRNARRAAKIGAEKRRALKDRRAKP